VFKERDDDDDEHFVDVVVDEDDDNDTDASSAMATTTAAAAERAGGDADRLSASSSSWVHRNNLACMLHTRIITILFLCLCPSEAKAICYQIVRQSVRVCVLTCGQMHSCLFTINFYTMSQNDTDIGRYSFDVYQPILIIFLVGMLLRE